MQTPNSTKRIATFVLFMFTFGTMFLHGANQQKLLGIIMIMVCFVTSLQYIFSRHRPPELTCYTFWIAWAATGFIVGLYFYGFLQYYWMALQMLVMVWAVYALLRKTQAFKYIFIAIICGGILQLGYMLINPQVLVSGLEEGRFSGITSNANTYGFLMLWTIGSCMLFWFKGPDKRISIVRQAVLGGIIALAAYGVVLSGSRKSFITLLFILGAWVLVTQHVKTPLAMFRLMAMVVVAGVFMFLGFEWVMENTFIGWRMQEFWELGEGSITQAAQSNVRYHMYKLGWRLSLKYPIFGVGLGHFRAYFPTGQYSHSNYIEPLVTTGFIGFVLFQAMYFVPLYRLTKLIRRETNALELYQLKVMRIILAAIMLIGLGAPQYSSQPVFLILITIATYTWLRNNETTRLID